MKSKKFRPTFPIVCAHDHACGRVRGGRQLHGDRKNGVRTTCKQHFSIARKRVYRVVACSAGPAVSHASPANAKELIAATHQVCSSRH
jgi:hypothetical protein